MRPFSYVLALILLLSGPSMAGSADHDLPGIGTFSYNGSPVVSPAPRVMAAISENAEANRDLFVTTAAFSACFATSDPPRSA